MEEENRKERKVDVESAETIEAKTQEPLCARRSAFAVLFILLLLTAGMRVVRLSSDPPADFSWSGGYFADEGYWSHNARNEVLFGKPVMDEWDARAVSPIFASLQRVCFRLFGVGLVQVRLIGILSSLLLAACVFLFCRKQLGDQVAFACALVASLNFPMLVIARQGILDGFSAALASLAFLLALSAGLPGIFLSGAVLVAACTTKYLMIYALLPLLWLVYYMSRSRKNVLVFVCGAVAAAAVWLLGSYLPNRGLLLGYGSYYSSQQSWQLLAVAKNVVLQPFYLYFIKTPAVLCFANLMAWYLLSVRLFRSRTDLGRSAVESAAWWWLVVGVCFFALWRYRPLRYYASVLAPMSILAALALFSTTEIAAAFYDRRRRWLLWAGMFLPAAQIALVLADRLGGSHWIPPQVGISAWNAAVFLLLTASVIALVLSSKARWLPVAFVLAFLATDMAGYLSWMIRPQYQALEIARDLQQRAPRGVVTGQWAPELCLENKLQAVPVWHGFVNSDRPFEKYGITHLLLWRYPLGDELEKFREWYPEEMRRCRYVKSYTIKGSVLELYRKEEGSK